jgi:hypothetical protein
MLVDRADVRFGVVVLLLLGGVERRIARCFEHRGHRADVLGALRSERFDLLIDVERHDCALLGRCETDYSLARFAGRCEAHNAVLRGAR